jgi:hypothetical protein
VLAESQAEVESAKALLRRMRAAYPEVMRLVATLHLAQSLLLEKDRFVGELERTGVATTLASDTPLRVQTLLRHSEKPNTCWPRRSACLPVSRSVCPMSGTRALGGRPD